MCQDDGERCSAPHPDPMTQRKHAKFASVAAEEVTGFGLSVLPDVWSFFKQKTAYEMESRDWSSDVCSSD
eukprot:COSAG05_NODE_5279_length_1217_cov_1.032200_3_plen_69_part_01